MGPWVRKYCKVRRYTVYIYHTHTHIYIYMHIHICISLCMYVYAFLHLCAHKNAVYLQLIYICIFLNSLYLSTWPLGAGIHIQAVGYTCHSWQSDKHSDVAVAIVWTNLTTFGVTAGKQGPAMFSIHLSCGMVLQTCGATFASLNEYAWVKIVEIMGRIGLWT